MAMYDSTHTGAEVDNAVKAVLDRNRLTDFSLTDLKSAVADNSLAKYGLKVGDEKTINGHKYIIAGLNPMKGTKTPERIKENHVGLIVVPGLTSKWNESGNTYTGSGGRGAGYLNSDFHYYLKNTVLPLVNTDLGAANILGHRKMMSNSVNQSGVNRFGLASGCANGQAWDEDCKISALSEIQLYGSNVWSSSGFDTGEACRQLDVFREYSPNDIFGGTYFYLRDIASATEATFFSRVGYAGTYPANTLTFVAALVLYK